MKSRNHSLSGSDGYFNRKLSAIRRAACRSRLYFQSTLPAGPSARVQCRSRDSSISFTKGFFLCLIFRSRSKVTGCFRFRVGRFSAISRLRELPTSWPGFWTPIRELRFRCHWRHRRKFRVLLKSRHSGRSAEFLRKLSQQFRRSPGSKTPRSARRHAGANGDHASTPVDIVSKDTFDGRYGVAESLNAVPHRPPASKLRESENGNGHPTGK